jgi:hypothetical protein
VADGPRGDAPDDEHLVARTRAVVSKVDWPCEVLTNYSEANLGCGRRVSGGLNWVFSSTPEAIILEDDCLPHASFFPYCEQLLERYRDDERVHMIGGSNVTGWRSPYSYYFSGSFLIWGWATWSRAWEGYDYEMRDWPGVRGTRWLRDRLPDRRAASVVQEWFDETHAGRIDQWDFQFVFHSWLRNAVSVLPSVNLISNVGYGADATHEFDAGHPFASRPTEAMGFPMSHPPDVEVAEEADQMMWNSLLSHTEADRRGPLHQLAAIARRGRRALRR